MIRGIDRDATLRKAEKLLRQGRLDAAIAEYLRVVEDQPRDWNTANTLGDLYVRAGQIDRAVEQYVRIADTWPRRAFCPKAAALYKKILKLKPDDEQRAAASRRRSPRARGCSPMRRRRSRISRSGAGARRPPRRGGDADPPGRAGPGRLRGRLAGARAMAELKDAAAAVRELKELSADLRSEASGRGDQGAA